MAEMCVFASSCGLIERTEARKFGISRKQTIIAANMKKTTLLLAALALLSLLPSAALAQWQGKRCAFLGDSMTDPNNRAATYHYYDYLRDSLGIEPRVYARSGHQWHQILEKAKLMQQTDSTTIDVIFIWAGTNDYNHSIPMGRFYAECDTVCNRNGRIVPARHREWLMNDSTFCGRINMCLSWLKHEYPTTQVIVMTPIHRALADFSDLSRNKYNVQPDEDYSNERGLYVEEYINALRQACQYWAVPCIDLFQDSGLYPMEPRHGVYFAEPEHKEGTARYDRLHPNNAGHIRLGRTIAAHLRAISPTL